MKIRPLKTIEMAALLAAATVGDGIFALPYMFHKAGWLVSVLYLAILGGFVVLAHQAYIEVLEKEGEKKRLLGLARQYFGSKGFWIGFVAIIGGLLLTLLAYLILGSEFIRLALPAVPSRVAFVIFWLLISVPVFMDSRYARELELVGVGATICAVFAIFFASVPKLIAGGTFFENAPIANPAMIFLPFGAVLFSLAGWTGIETVYESRRAAAIEEAERTGSPAPDPASSRGRIPWTSLASGTLLAALVYVMFSSGILGSAPTITPDTASGLTAWPLWQRELGAFMGLVAVATAYIPMSREIRNSLERDLSWSKSLSRAVILFVPPALIGFGLHSFLIVVSLVGGLFLSTQYVLIISVGRRALSLRPTRKFFLDFAALLFVIAAVYQIFTFVVH